MHKLAIFNKFFKRDKDNFVNLDDFKDGSIKPRTKEGQITSIEVGGDDTTKDTDEINKSFTKGRSESHAGLSSLNSASFDAPTGNSNKLPKDFFIRRKQILRMFGTGNLVAQSIIRTRTSQIRKFANPSRETADGIGFQIIPRDQEGKKYTDEQIKEIHRLEDFIYNTGKEYHSYRDTLATFLTKLVFDYYVYDQINIERLFESPTSNKLNHFNIADAGTIVIDKLPSSKDSKRQFSQIIDNKEVHKFNERNMTFITYWDTGDVNSFGYGYSPVEASMAHLGYFNDTEQFNARFFKQGGTTRGLLVINAGDNQYSQVALESLRRTWTSLKGVNGAWKIPVMTAADAKFVNMTQSSKDMEFEEWLNYLINVLAGVFQINPEEINFPNKGGGATGKGGGATFESKGSARDRSSASKEKGLTPLLKFIESIINDEILRYVNKDYRFEFTMGDTGEEQRTQDLISTKLKNGMTLNEAREANGLPHKEGFDTPGDSNNWVQYQTIQAKTDPASSYTQQHKNDANPTNGDAPEFNPNKDDKSQGDEDLKQPLPPTDKNKDNSK